MVGLLTEGDRDVRVREALVVPVATILGAWPELQHAVSRSPYPGLAPFTVEDARFFHGRGHVASELAAALTTEPHLVVLAGPSGSGKSSLIAAGILPRLDWKTITWRPGKAPFHELARAVLRAQHPEAAPTTLSVEAARLANDLATGRVTLADVLIQDRHARWAIAV